MYSRPKTTSTIKLSRQDQNLRVDIINNGPAITEEDLPLIFNKFFRGSNKAIDVPSGDLSLYIARGHIAVLGGKI